jgi:hypothetical protein
MKKFLLPVVLILISIGFSTFITAQNIEREIVYLKNGKICKGKRISGNDITLVKIKDSLNQIHVFNGNEIDHINKEIILNEEPEKPKTKKEFKMLGELAYMGKKSRDQFFIMNATAIGGYQFSDVFFVGIGTGFDVLDIHVAPVFADFRLYLNGQTVSPFFQFDAGYAFPYGKIDTEEVAEGGSRVSTGFGLKVKTKRERSIFFTLGYRHQKIKSQLKNYYGTQNVDRSIEYNRILFKVGWYFN